MAVFIKNAATYEWWFKIYELDTRNLYPKNAKILINGVLIDGFQIEKGTHQGCLLSPFLFTFALEVLAAKIRQDPKTKGLKTDGEEFKLKSFDNLKS